MYEFISRRSGSRCGPISNHNFLFEHVIDGKCRGFVDKLDFTPSDCGYSSLVAHYGSKISYQRNHDQMRDSNWHIRLHVVLMHF